MENKNNGYLTGKLLLAMPMMGDTRFDRAVIYMCVHDENGAMGLVVNHVLQGLAFPSLLRQLNIDSNITFSRYLTEMPVINGGPVETARGFILHGRDFNHPDTVRIDDTFSLTGTVDALRDVALGKGPEKMVFTLGYAGWSAQQLDSELLQNAWLTCPADPDIVFSTPPQKMWDKAVSSLGIDPGKLSFTAGRA